MGPKRIDVLLGLYWLLGVWRHILKLSLKYVHIKSKSINFASNSKQEKKVRNVLIVGNTVGNIAVSLHKYNSGKVSKKNTRNFNEIIHHYYYNSFHETPLWLSGQSPTGIFPQTNYGRIHPNRESNVREFWMRKALIEIYVPEDVPSDKMCIYSSMNDIRGGPSWI